jgi:hypothetical protein
VASYTNQSDPGLLQWELDEKARVAAEQEASKATYKALKAEWERYLASLGGNSSGNNGLIQCDPLQYAADVKIMGPDGGDMSIGPHKLSIPRGALKQYVVITGEMPVSMAVSVKCSPEGLVFAKQPKLTLSYKHCNRPADYQERVAYTTDSYSILEYLRSLDHAADGLVDGWLNHFSKYAIAW